MKGPETKLEAALCLLTLYLLMIFTVMRTENNVETFPPILDIKPKKLKIFHLSTSEKLNPENTCSTLSGGHSHLF